MSTHYLMESCTENHRLAKKVNPEKFVQHYLADKIQFSKRVLDIGCGPAVIDEHLARTFQNIQITAVDISVNRIIEASKNIQQYSNLSFVSANVYDLPFDDNAYDFVFSRFVFEYLKYPQKALSEIKRVCRQNGTIMVQDIDGQFISQYPEDMELSENIKLIFQKINQSNGFDQIIGRKLFHLFRVNDIRQIDVQFEPYHLIYGEINSQEYDDWKNKLFTGKTHLEQHSDIEHNLNKYIELYLAYLKRDDTLSFSNLFTVYGIK